MLPDEAVAYWCQGDAYQALGQLALAQQAFETAVRVDPDNEDAWKRLAGWRECRQGTSGKVRRMIFKARSNDQVATVVLLASRYLQSHPDDLGVIFDYAESLYLMTRYDEAIRVYLDAIDRFPEKRWALFNKMGSLFRYRGDFDTAAKWFQRGTEERPDDAGSFIFLGGVLARQGKLTQAEESHRRATRCTHGCVDEAHLNLGLVLRGQGRLAEAADRFRKAIELRPKYADAIEALLDVEAALTLSGEDDPERGVARIAN